VHRQDMRMVERRRSLRFALKAAACRGIGELVGKQLHRNATIQPGVERLVYDAHSTFTKLTLNSVRTDFQVRRGHGGPIVADSARFVRVAQTPLFLLKRIALPADEDTNLRRPLSCEVSLAASILL